MLSTLNMQIPQNMDLPENKNKPEIIPNNGNTKKLSAKEQRFVDEYCTHWNGAEAARQAGYSPEYAGVMACQMLNKTHIKIAVDAQKAALSQKCLVSNEYIIGLLRDVAETGAQKIPVRGHDGITKMVDPASVAKSAELMGKHAGTWEADNAQKDHGVQVLIQQYAGNASNVGQLGPSSASVQVQRDSPSPCIEGSQGETVPTDEADDQ